MDAEAKRDGEVQLPGRILSPVVVTRLPPMRRLLAISPPDTMTGGSSGEEEEDSPDEGDAFIDAGGAGGSVATSLQSPRLGAPRPTIEYSNSIMRLLVQVVNQRDAFHQANLRRSSRAHTRRMYFVSDVTAAIVQAVRTMYMAIVVALGVMWFLEATGHAGGFAPDAGLVCVAEEPGSEETCGVWRYGVAQGTLLIVHAVIIAYSFFTVRWRTDTMNLRWLRTAATTYVALGGVYAQLPSTTATTLVALFLSVLGCCVAAWFAERSRGHGMIEVQVVAKLTAVVISVTLGAIGLVTMYDSVSRFDRVVLVFATVGLLLSTLNIVRVGDGFSSQAPQRELQDMWLIVGNGVLDMSVLVTAFVLAVHFDKE